MINRQAPPDCRWRAVARTSRWRTALLSTRLAQATARQLQRSFGRRRAGVQRGHRDWSEGAPPPLGSLVVGLYAGALPDADRGVEPEACPVPLACFAYVPVANARPLRRDFYLIGPAAVTAHRCEC